MFVRRRKTEPALSMWNWNTELYACDSNLIYQSFNPKNGIGVLQGLFYYHSDHLGSASWITDASGMPIQFIHYQPYGELYINYKTTAYDERFKFTGKERDAETDYDYFGARYYASICPSFISVDPLADNYPGLNPYAYCGWNPVAYINPDGKDSIYVYDQMYRPKDDGTYGTSYTAKIVVVQNGVVVGEYRGSSYPNSKSNKDNTTSYNTIKEGDYLFSNNWGHKGGQEKGLNIVDNNNERFVTGYNSQGEDVIMQNVNVHSGKSDNGNYNSRGSQGCITIHPEDVNAFFSNFIWTNSKQTTGISNGRIFIIRAK